MRKSLLALGTVLIAVSAISAVPAHAATGAKGVKVECGKAIADNTTAYLANDLHCNLKLGYGVTVDLNGHVLSGIGTHPGTAFELPVGSGSSDALAVTVKNGTIRNWHLVFDAGFEGAVTLSHLLVENSGTVVGGFRVGAKIDSSTFTGNTSVVAGEIVTVAISNSKFRKNEFVVAEGSDGGGSTTVTGSKFVDNRSALSCNNSSLSVSHSTFIGNTAAIAGMSCLDTKITDNKFRNNVTAVTANTQVSEQGIDDPAVLQAKPDQVLRNSFVRNGTAVDVIRSGTYSGNTFDRNKTGIRSTVTQYSAGIALVVTKNTFTRNGDGINATNPVSIGQNIATRNTHYGIYVPHATDLGGNIALRNGVNPQCTGVVCAIS